MPGELAEQFLEVDVCVLAELEDNDAALELVQLYEELTRGVIQQLHAYAQLTDVSRAAQAWPSAWASVRELRGSSLCIGLIGVAALIESLKLSDISTLRECYPPAVEQLRFAVEESVENIMGHLISELHWPGIHSVHASVGLASRCDTSLSAPGWQTAPWRSCQALPADFAERSCSC